MLLCLPLMMLLAAEPAPAAAVDTSAPRASSEHLVRAHVSAALALLVTNVATFGIAYAPPRAHFEATGTPDLWLTSLSVAFAVTAQVMLAHWLVPGVMLLGDDPAVAAQSDAIRSEAWRYTRWAVLAAVVSLAAMATGALLERGEFGRGQTLWLTGLGGLAASWVAFDVLELVGLSRGYQAAVRPP